MRTLRILAMAVAVMVAASCGGSGGDGDEESGGWDADPVAGCVAVVDVSSPLGEPNQALKGYADALNNFRDDCQKVNAAFALTPAVGGTDDLFTPMSFDRLISDDECEDLDQKELDECEAQFEEQQNLVDGFIGNLRKKGPERVGSPTSNVVDGLKSGAASLATRDYEDRRLLVMTPGFQTAGTVQMPSDFAPDGVKDLIAEMKSSGLVNPDIAQACPVVVGVGNWAPANPDVVMNPDYAAAVAQFWPAYLEAAGLENGAGRVVASYQSPSC